MKQNGERNPDVVYKTIQVSVPENADRLIRQLCKMDGTDIDEFYRDKFLDSLESFFNS